MPLAAPLLHAYRQATADPPLPTGECWLIALREPPGAPVLAKVGPTTADDLANRLDQAGLDWSWTALSSPDWQSPAVLITGIERGRAIRLAHKLRRWGLLRGSAGRLQVLYTGLSPRKK